MDVLPKLTEDSLDILSMFSRYSLRIFSMSEGREMMGKEITVG